MTVVEKRVKVFLVFNGSVKTCNFVISSCVICKFVSRIVCKFVS